MSLFFSSKTIIKTALLVFACTLMTRMTYYSFSQGFSLNRISLSHVSQTLPQSTQPSPQQLDLLHTKTKSMFHFLAKGSQAYAFISEDNSMVLKLFKFHHMHPHIWLSKLPLPTCAQRYRDSLLQRRKHRIQLALNSYQIVQNHLQEECGIIFTQISPSSSYSMPATIRDGVHRVYSIDLAHYGFAVQRKAALVIPSFTYWIQHNQQDKARQAIDSLIALVVRRSKKSIQDLDPDIHKNAGLIDTVAIHIDIGSFVYNPEMQNDAMIMNDTKKIFSPLHSWLLEHSPELALHLQKQLENPMSLQWVPPI